MKYTMSFCEQIVLDGGTPFQLRAIRPSDKKALAQAFEQLSPDSRRSRFHAAKTTLTEADLRFLTECDEQHHYAIIAACDDSETGNATTGVGVARFIRSADDPAVAELGITVVDAWQGRGIGGLLSDRIVAAAAERGVERLRAVILAHNNRIRGLIKSRLTDATVTVENGTLTVDYPVAAISRPRPDLPGASAPLVAPRHPAAT